MGWRGSWTRRAGTALAGALLVAGIGYRLGGYPLLDPDEGRNSEVAREMVASGDFLVPHLDGLPYLDKPVLFYAVDAASLALLGTAELPARLPALLFSLGTAALICWFGRRLFGPAAGWIAAVAALAAPLPVVFARTVIFDSALTFFLVLALAAFYCAIEAAARATPATLDVGAGGSAAGGLPPGGARRQWLGWTALAWAAMGLGVLTKGPVALAVPLLAAVPYAIWRRRSRAVWHPLGPAALALVVAPWVWAMSRQVPEFLRYVLVTETWQRMTTDELHRTGPFWYFAPLLLAGTLPWSAVALGGWRRGCRLRGAGGELDGRLLYLLLWIALPFVLFSLSHSKRPQYILPLAPAVALLAAALLGAGGGPDRARADHDRDQPRASGRTGEPDHQGGRGAAGQGDEAPPSGQPGLGRLPGARAAAGSWLALGGILAVAGPVVARLPHALPTRATLLPPTLLALGLTLAGCGIAAWFGAARRRVAVAALALPMAALPVLVMPALAQIGRERSAREVAAAIAPHLAAGGTVVGIHTFPPSLPFYLRQPLIVTSRAGRELTSNYVIQYYAKWLAAPATPLRPPDWWRQALATCDRPWVFVVWSDDRQSREALEAAGMPRLLVTDRYAAYGPCRPTAPRASPAAPP
ncbi:MAG TPA: phospholipid carrier-dependent glycosyltransferase [Thermoanaerobaculia bacterium]|nr:phospholipid carrier-dependent glycosyltransferase [Thermoanaerobaculia bacterium]